MALEFKNWEITVKSIHKENSLFSSKFDFEDRFNIALDVLKKKFPTNEGWKISVILRTQKHTSIIVWY